MTGRKSEQEFIDAVKSAFDDGVEGLDTDTLSRLNSIRHAAVESFSCRKYSWWLYPAGVFVTASLAIIIFTLIQPENITSTVKAEDIEILSTSEELDIYEDLEFYQWLEDYEISA